MMHVTPPKGLQPKHLHPVSASWPNQNMDPNVSNYDPSTKIFYGNSEAYVAKFPDYREAKTFERTKVLPGEHLCA